MRHRRKTKKVILFDQNILRFKLEALYTMKNNSLLLPVSFVIKKKVIIIIIIKPRNVDAYSFERAFVFVSPVRC